MDSLEDSHESDSVSDSVADPEMETEGDVDRPDDLDATSARIGGDGCLANSNCGVPPRLMEYSERFERPSPAASSSVVSRARSCCIVV
jgi:hypothetical protein